MVRTMREHVEATIEVIRPALQADGGDIVLRSVDASTGVVEIEVFGACVGCPSSDASLEVGVARIIRDRVDGVTRVVNVAVATGGVCAHDAGGAGGAHTADGHAGIAAADPV